jgi:hypothetical protein
MVVARPFDSSAGDATSSDRSANKIARIGDLAGLPITTAEASSTRFSLLCFSRTAGRCPRFVPNWKNVNYHVLCPSIAQFCVQSVLNAKLHAVQASAPRLHEYVRPWAW